MILFLYVLMAPMPSYFASIYFPECLNYRHHSSFSLGCTNILPLPCSLFVLAPCPPNSVQNMSHSLPQHWPPPTLGVLEVNTRYTPDDSTGLPAVRKGKST